MTFTLVVATLETRAVPDGPREAGVSRERWWAVIVAVQRSQQLRIQVQDGDECLVRLVGELDIYTVDEVRRTIEDLVARHPCDIVLDLSALQFTDVRGLATIVRGSRLVSEHGQAMRIVGAGRMVRKILALTGDDQRLNLSETRPAT